MSDPDPASDPRRSARWTLAVTAALLLAAAAFATGRATAPGPEPEPAGATTAECDEATTVVDEALAAADNEPEGSDDKRNYTLIAANVITQNPDCFGPELRATAQTLLDQDNSP